MNLNKFMESMIEAVKKLGPLGTISYVGALFLYVVATQVNFSTDLPKALLLSGIGTALLFYSGVVYVIKVKLESEIVREALKVLSGVYNRMAEQLGKTDKEQTVSITMTIDNLPNKISEVIKKSSQERK